MKLRDSFSGMQGSIDVSERVNPIFFHWSEQFIVHIKKPVSFEKDKEYTEKPSGTYYGTYATSIKS